MASVDQLEKTMLLPPGALSLSVSHLLNSATICEEAQTTQTGHQLVF